MLYNYMVDNYKLMFQAGYKESHFLYCLWPGMLVKPASYLPVFSTEYVVAETRRAETRNN